MGDALSVISKILLLCLCLSFAVCLGQTPNFSHTSATSEVMEHNYGTVPAYDQVQDARIDNIEANINNIQVDRKTESAKLDKLTESMDRLSGGLQVLVWLLAISATAGLLPHILTLLAKYKNKGE